MPVTKSVTRCENFRKRHPFFGKEHGNSNLRLRIVKGGYPPVLLKSRYSRFLSFFLCKMADNLICRCGKTISLGYLMNKFKPMQNVIRYIKDVMLPDLKYKK
jgi:hypothetical protein